MISLVEELHLQPQDRRALWHAAMKGVAGHLDRHSAYFTPTQFEQHLRDMSGKLVGIGAFFRTDGKLLVQSTRRGGPAQNAGLRKGDHLRAVDGKEVATFEDAARLLQGKQGTSVTLSITRDGQRMTLPVRRAAVEVNPVRTRLTRDGIGYVRLASFDHGAARKVRRAIHKLQRRNQRRNGARLGGLVLDLRNNPGGLLPEAVALVNDFVAPGTVVTIRGRGEPERHDASPSRVRHPTLPLTVLVNERTASASELVAGALGDFGRARLIGVKTYGKGTMQEVIPMPDGSGLKLTTARYHLPAGATPHEVGVEPHVTREAAKQRFTRPPGDRRTIIDYSLEEALAQLRGQR
jgi:carboxyl-terminal processing protease